MHGLRRLFLAALTLLMFGGCSGPGGLENIPVEDARALNSQLTAFNAGTLELFTDTANAIDRVGTIPTGIRPQDFELALVRNALMACFNQSITFSQPPREAPRGVTANAGDDLAPLTERNDLGNAAFCNPNQMIALESYVDAAPQNIREFIIDRVLRVDELRVNLRYVLQERLNLLEEMLADARGTTVQLRDASREIYEDAQTSDDVSPEQRRQIEADYEVIQNEIDSIENDLLEPIDAEIDELRAYRIQLIDDVGVRLSAMGTPGS